MSFNPFIAGSGKACPVQKITPRDKVELVTYYLADEVVSVDEKNPKNFLLRKVPAVKEKLALNFYIQSFEKDVGVSNIIGKMQDNELADFINRAKLPSDGVVYDGDLLNNMSDIQADKLIAAGEAAWNAIPSDLKAGLNKEEFVKSFNYEKLAKYAESLAKVSETKMKEEGEK